MDGESDDVLDELVASMRLQLSYRLHADGFELLVANAAKNFDIKRPPLSDDELAVIAANDEIELANYV